MDSDLLIPVGHKYGAIFVKDAWPIGFTGWAKVGRGLWVGRGKPFDLDERWQHRLGTARKECVDAANLVLLCTRPSEQCGIVDAEDKLVCKRVFNYLLALVICGQTRMGDLFFCGGSRTTRGLETRNTSHPNLYHVFANSKLCTIDVATSKLAARVLDGIEDLERTDFSQPTTPLYRLRLGLASLAAAFRDRYPPERLHLATRAVEAAIKPRTGGTRRDFKQRCRVFANGVNLGTVLGEIYDMRSAVEHSHFRMPDTIAQAADPERAQRERCYQIECIARLLYQRLLTTAELRDEVFASEATLDAFWDDDEARRIATFGCQTNVDAVLQNLS